ncbi:MAG: MFS transporter [Ostreibacterium sp.]
MMSERIDLFKSKRFLPLFVTQFFGAFNDNAFKNAFLIWFTYDIAVKTGANAQIMVSIAAGLFILPFFLFSALAGQFADKYEKSQLVQTIKQVEIGLMLICSFGFYTQNIYLLLIILFLMGCQSTFFGPLKYSLLPLHLKENELIAGNGFIEGGTFIAILLGTIIGGLVIREQYGVEIIATIVILFSGIGYLSSRFIPKSLSLSPQLKLNFNLFSQTKNIIYYAKAERTVWLSIIAISWFWFIGATFLTLFPIYTKNIINGNEEIVTLFLATFSIGIAIGSVICNHLLKGKIDGRFVPHGTLGMTLSIIAFFVFSNLYINNLTNPTSDLVPIGVYELLFTHLYGAMILLSLLFLAICSGIFIVPLYTIMQHRSDKQYLAQIIAANNVMNALFMVCSSLIGILLFSLNMNANEILLAVGIANIPVYFITKNMVKKG